MNLVVAVVAVLIMGNTKITEMILTLKLILIVMIYDDYIYVCKNIGGKHPGVDHWLKFLKALDTVNWGVLWSTLMQHGVSQHLVWVLHDFTTHLLWSIRECANMLLIVVNSASVQM